MIIDFKYSMVYDLMFHILAHMKVENASNLYSKKYIDNINKIKNDGHNNIEEKLSCLTKYYNENFERLGIINFLPFYCSSSQEMTIAMENYNGFTETDKERFVFPLNQLINDEYNFYESYWNRLYDTTQILRDEFESQIMKELNKYKVLFSYFKKSAVVGVSYSLTNNGRGLGDKNVFNAVVPFVYDKKQYKNSFYQILHEYTHQFTDIMLGGIIKMDDETHSLSENAVVLFDYYLIKKLYKQDINSYFKWIGMLLNIDCSDEKVFLSAFEIKKDINEKLLELVNVISAI
jgi:hypothetical protein